MNAINADKSFDLYKADENDLHFSDEIDQLLMACAPPAPLVEIEQKAIEAQEYAISNPMPDINRAHRECERECLDLKARVNALESLLARASVEFQQVLYGNQSCFEMVRLSEEIDAILPRKDANNE